MYNEYMDKLVESLRNAKVYKGNTELADYEAGMTELMALFLETKRSQKKLMFVGNGGSAAIATHMTTDFMKNGRMRACSLMEGSVLTCMGNDYGYEYVFSKQIELLGSADDLLVAISSSGNSKNITNAIEAAKAKGMKVVTLSGFRPDNQIKAMGDLNVYVGIEHYGIVESAHISILQQIVDEIFAIDGAE